MKSFRSLNGAFAILAGVMAILAMSFTKSQHDTSGLLALTSMFLTFFTVILGFLLWIVLVFPLCGITMLIAKLLIDWGSPALFNLGHSIEKSITKNRGSYNFMYPIFAVSFLVPAYIISQHAMLGNTSYPIFVYAWWFFGILTMLSAVPKKI